MKHKLLCLLILLISAIPANAATTLLPPGMQCFTDATGAVISGSVNMFYPSTTTAKPTWQDSAQVSLNSQPIQLDGNGCATIYGIGSYRQQLYDGPVVGGNTTGTLIFDKITTDTSAFNSTFWAGLSTGTPNVITIVDPGFNGTDGTIVNFTALSTNTGSATLNPSGFGNVNIVKSTTAGPVSLVGGEIVQSNQVSVIYSASANTFTILNPPIVSASGNIAPLCGASGLKVVNGSSPSSIIAITANAVVMVSSGGLVQSRTTISLTALNITTGTATSTANGMDGEAPGTSSWVYIWLVDNGSATAALASLASGNGLAPSLPSGYTYKCLMGAMPVDGSGNLYRLLQQGIESQYTVITPSNTAALPKVDNGTVGTFSLTASPMTVWKSETVRGNTTQFIPPIAVSGNFVINNKYNNANTAQIAIAPNASYGGPNSTNPAPCSYVPNTTNIVMECAVVFEADTSQAASSDTGFGLFVRGFRLGGVNAN